VVTEHEHQDPGPSLALFMRRHGWSAARLAEIAGGVSASSVRAYTADRSTPRPTQALAVANALGPQDGHSMLEAWGYTDLAEGFKEDWQRATAGHEGRGITAAEFVSRGGRGKHVEEPLSEAGLTFLRAAQAWVESVEMMARGREAR